MFRRFEPLIAQAVRAFPAETSFTIPSDMAPTTFLARFRDARLSFLRFNWPSTLIDREKLISIQGQHTISYDSGAGLVWFRQKQRRGRPVDFVVQTDTIGATPAATPTIRWETWEDADILALARLLDRKLLTNTFVLVGKVPDELASSLSTYDIALSYSPETNETIII